MPTVTNLPEPVSPPGPIPARKFPDWPNGEQQSIRDAYDAQQRGGGEKK